MFTAFRSRASRLEWKAFEFVNANEEIMQGFALPHKFETQLTQVMERKVRLPVCIPSPKISHSFLSEL